MARLAPALVAALLLAPLSGCVEITPARVPDRYLEGRGGNGWEKNLTASQSEPSSAGLGFTKTQALAYEDKVAEPGYPGFLVVTTLRAVPAPSAERIREHVDQSVRDAAAAKGIALKGEPAAGSRTLASGVGTTFLVYQGNVSTSGFFSRNADVKILGEVFECEDAKTVVAVVGLAQVSDVRIVRPNPLLPPTEVPSDRDETTWREIAGDPSGTVDGQRGSEALAWRVEC
ncbi:MAG TPA: hypothetical protein VHH36_09830 [Candidatus Thermoplasmatota archaeon]|nr:hypothetical protein [Candidatus Thermoplasmatota archaeon]